MAHIAKESNTPDRLIKVHVLHIGEDFGLCFQTERKNV
jgi:hypothetical protein